MMVVHNSKGSRIGPTFNAWIEELTGLAPSQSCPVDSGTVQTGLNDANLSSANSFKAAIFVQHFLPKWELEKKV